MGPNTTYRCGGAARLAITVDDPDGLSWLGATLVDLDRPVEVVVVGRGSNMLWADGVQPIVAVSLGSGFETIEFDGLRVVAGAGVSLPVLARRSVSSGLTGFEWAVGVPGSIGGAVRMNAGGHGSELANSLVEVRVVSLDGGHNRIVPVAELDLSYRHSGLAATDVVVAATLQLAPGDGVDGAAELEQIVSWRRANQPGGPNAGSVFTNPPGHSAGALIDVCGLKGARRGGAEISTRHANFIQAGPTAAAADVVALMELIVDRVERHRGVRLHAETRLVGFSDQVVAGLGAQRGGGIVNAGRANAGRINGGRVNVGIDDTGILDGGSGQANGAAS
jgi:UDP-N-acetylmuramate dehydrogenase